MGKGQNSVRLVTYNKSVQCKQGLKSEGIQTSIEVTDQISQTQNNPLYNVLKCPALNSPMKQHIESDDYFSSPEKEPVCDDPDYFPSSESDSDSECDFSSVTSMKGKNCLILQLRRKNL